MSAFNPVEESNNEPLIVKQDSVTGKWNATIVPKEESIDDRCIVKQDPFTGKWNATIVLKDEYIDSNCIVEKEQNKNNQSDDSDPDSANSESGSFYGTDLEEVPEKPEELEEPKKPITYFRGRPIDLLKEDDWTCIGCQYKEFSLVAVLRNGIWYEEPKYIVDRSKGLCYCSGGCMYVKAGPFVYAEKDPLFEELYGPNCKLKGHPNIIKF